MTLQSAYCGLTKSDNVVCFDFVTPDWAAELINAQSLSAGYFIGCTKWYICIFSSVLMYKTQTQPWSGKIIRTFWDFIKRNEPGLSKQGSLFGAAKSTFSPCCCYCWWKKQASQLRQSMQKQPWLSSRKFSHWMINTGPGDAEQSSSLSPFPPKFGRYCALCLLKVNTGWPTCTLQ